MSAIQTEVETRLAESEPEVEVILADVAMLGSLQLMAMRRGTPAWPWLAGYTLALTAMGPIVGQQFDIFPAAFTLAAIYCFWRQRHSAGWVFIALGTLTPPWRLGERAQCS